MSLSIRAARSDDAGLILSLVRELAEFEKLAHEVDATEAMIAEALFGPRATTFCDIAAWDGAPVGLALTFLNFSSFRGRNGLYLEDLYVRPDFRGRGIGEALLRRLAQKCVANGWTRLEWSVLDWNRGAIDFYQKLGAVVMQDWRICRVTGAALSLMAQTPA